jgi:hypothetical protein
VTNNKGFWIWWLGLLVLHYNYSWSKQLRHWTPSERRLSCESLTALWIWDWSLLPADFNSGINSLLISVRNLIEIAVSKGSIAVLHECVSETMPKFPSNGLFSKCLQFSVSVSMETVFRNWSVSRNQSLRGNVFSHSFPRNGPCVTIYWFRCEWLAML